MHVRGEGHFQDGLLATSTNYHCFWKDVLAITGSASTALGVLAMTLPHAERTPMTRCASTAHSDYCTRMLCCRDADHVLSVEVRHFIV